MSALHFRNSSIPVNNNNDERIVRDYIVAVGERRLDDVAELLDPNMTFSGPGLEPRHGADGYLAALRRLSPIIVGNDIRRVLVDGSEACVIYDFVTDPVGAVGTVEWLRIEHGRITSVWLLFDKARWPEVLERLAQLTPAPG